MPDLQRAARQPSDRRRSHRQLVSGMGSGRYWPDPSLNATSLVSSGPKRGSCPPAAITIV